MAANAASSATLAASPDAAANPDPAGSPNARWALSLAAAAGGLSLVAMVAIAAGWVAFGGGLAVAAASVLVAFAAGWLALRRAYITSPPVGSRSSASPSATSPLATEAIWHRRVFDDAPIAIAVLGSDRTLVAVNAGFAGLFEDGTAVEGRPLTELLQAAGERPLGDLLDDPAGAGDGPIDVTFQGRGRDGSGQSGSLYVGPLEDGVQVVHLIDTTKQRMLELQFTQSQKMLAVGKLAGGIAHDFNNLLTAMTGNCDLLLLCHQPGDPSFADIMQVKQNANRAANLVRQLLAFSRQQTLQPRLLNLADVLADLSSLLRRLLGAGIELRMEHGRDIGAVKVDRVQLEQVLINLSVNGRDAMGGEGTLTIATRDVLPDQVDNPRRSPPLPPQHWVAVEVTDTGTGIPDNILDRIFEPFFTTKDLGEGTGLGLSTVYGIVKQTGGFIYAENLREGGAKFSVFLPVHDQEAEEAVAPVAASPRPDLTGVGTVLLVEDEDPVRMFGARALRSKGYRVLEARTGRTALSLLSESEEAIDLLVTDVMMPEMDGPTLIERMRADRPDLPVICISGYAEGEVRDKIDRLDNIHFIPKPFTLSQLAGKVKSAMAGE